jgi:hypothetical protein
MKENSLILCQEEVSRCVKDYLEKNFGIEGIKITKVDKEPGYSDRLVVTFYREPKIKKVWPPHAGEKEEVSLPGEEDEKV